jgi:hypothetical protein
MQSISTAIIVATVPEPEHNAWGALAFQLVTSLTLLFSPYTDLRQSLSEGYCAWMESLLVSMDLHGAVYLSGFKYG